MPVQWRGMVYWTSATKTVYARLTDWLWWPCGGPTCFASGVEWPSLQVSESWPPTLRRYIFHFQIHRLYSGYLVTREISVLMCVWILSLMRTVSLHVHCIYLSSAVCLWPWYSQTSSWSLRTIKKKCNVINGNNTLIITMTITVVVWTGISGWFDAYT